MKRLILVTALAAALSASLAACGGSPDTTTPAKAEQQYGCDWTPVAHDPATDGLLYGAFCGSHFFAQARFGIGMTTQWREIITDKDGS